MGSMAVSFRTPVSPWAGSLEDEWRFRRIRHGALGLCAVLCAVLCTGALLMPIVKPDRSQPQELPPRLAKLLLKNAKPIPSPAPPPKAKLEPLAKPVERTVATDTPEPTKPAARRPEPPCAVALKKEAPVPEARAPLPNKPPGEIDAVRRMAAGVGLLAMSEDLAELHGAPMAVQLAPGKQGPGVGTGVGVGVGAGNEAGVPTRALITSNATGGSGGINTASYSRDTGGGGAGGGGARGVAARAVAVMVQGAQAAPCNVAAAAKPRVRSNRSSWFSNATTARSTRSTTAPCARRRACKAR